MKTIAKLTKVEINNFKRFERVAFDLPGDSIVIAGPNNAGKTTLLQAIATWQFVIEQWLNRDDVNPRKGYAWAPITRPAFFPVPLLKFDDLWQKKTAKKCIEIALHLEGGYFPVEIQYDTTEQILARPKVTGKNIDIWKELFKPDRLDRDARRRIFIDLLKPAFIPPMTGLALEEPLYQPPKIRQLLGQGKPGDVLRNLLVAVHGDDKEWENLCGHVNDTFGYQMLAPNWAGPNIRAEYRHDGVNLDIASAGSGFLQVLMLLSFLAVSKGAILLLDEPDAHLHILLQDRVYNTLKRLADDRGSTLIIATHSERIINATDPRRLCVLFDEPRPLVDDSEGREQRRALITALAVVDNTDIMLAKSAPGILYAEGHTDISILREWARALGHPLLGYLEQPFWKPTVHEDVDGGIQAEKHFEALRLVTPDIVGVDLRDGDGKDDRQTTLYALRNGLNRFFWGRYEIESYLIHPESIVQFVEQSAGQPEAAEKARAYLKNNLTKAILEDPLADHDYLKKTKGKDILGKTFEEAGLPHFSDYSRLAAAMRPEAIHPEVKEKLDAIYSAFHPPA